MNQDIDLETTRHVYDNGGVGVVRYLQSNVRETVHLGGGSILEGISLTVRTNLHV